MANNQTHLNELAKQYNVLCIQESWHLSYEQIDENLLIAGKKIFHKYATKTSKKGRPSGGLIFIVDSEIKCSAMFPSKRIGVLLINNLAIMNVYMPFGKDEESVLEFEIELNLIMKLIDTFENEKREIILTGDFNCDFSESTINTKRLREAMLLKRFIPVDLIHEQERDFTYFKVINNELKTPWPYHTFAKIKSNECIVKAIHVLGIGNNFGDHLTSVFRISYEFNPMLGSVINYKSFKKKYNWKNGKKTLSTQNWSSRY